MNNGKLQPDSLAQQQLQSNIMKKAQIDLSIEVVLLIVGGVFFLLFGALLFLIDRGMLPYSEGSMYGIFVVLVSMQIITMGKTPFGDVLRSWLVVVIGLLAAMLGTLAIFYPVHLNATIRIIAGLMVLIAGTVGMLQLFISEDKARVWMKVPGILQQLTVACALVYGIEIVLGIITLLPGIMPNPLTAVFLLLFGASLLFLARCIHMAAHQYRSTEAKRVLEPSTTKRGFFLLKETSLTVGNSFNIYQGYLLILLGILVLLMILGIIPSFNSDGQLGLLLVLTSLQLLALGEFMGKEMSRSWPAIALGILFAAIGFFSCIVPGILTGVIQPLIGLQNIISGVLLLATKIVGPRVYQISHPPAESVALPPIVKQLTLVLTVTGIVTILFGINMLAPLLLPGLFGMIAYALLVPLLIIIMGLMVLILVAITQKLNGMSMPSP
ncbi:MULTISPECIES: hypothetical protein [Methanothrix]|uniref:hypothetical protein n=1 Tax=Methanothrix TaxID=2222 RepID=UPI0025809747|nr:hypothetical protein [Methanosaeta sp. UBA356]HOE46706.1 hypothetical protein [Methanothrix soehngenii]HOS23566.1 hypothetical protein [Methanothrix soehngenii]HPL21967.1 hypothetical protein [Methanothrix soehngenii]